MQQKTVPVPPAQDVINILDYLEVVAKRWRMIVTVMALAFVISAVVSLMMTKIYRTSTLILPPQQDTSMLSMMSAMSGGMASLAGDLLGKGTPSDLYVGILKSRALKDALIDRFKLMDLFQRGNRVDTYEVLDKMALIEAGKKDGIISITVDGKDPKMIADLANAYVEELGKVAVRLNITGAGQNKGYLEKRLAKTKADLARAEDALKNFQSANKAVDVPEQAKASIMGVAQLKAQLAVQEVQLAALRSRFTESTQDVKDMKASVDNLRAQIAQVEGNERGSSIPSMGTVPQLGQEYVRLLREYKIQETVFEMLTKQYEMASLNEANDVNGIQVIQKATTPDKKVKPQRTLIVLASTFFAGFLALLYAFLLEKISEMPEEERNRLSSLIQVALRTRNAARS